MREKELYRRILGIQTPWEVPEIELDMKAGEVKVYVEQKLGTKQRCPRCGARCPGYDRHRRQWRHLGTCQLKTLLVAELPRVHSARNTG
jgi:transposase